jgi:hypothetical protein
VYSVTIAPKQVGGPAQITAQVDGFADTVDVTVIPAVPPPVPPAPQPPPPTSNPPGSGGTGSGGSLSPCISGPTSENYACYGSLKGVDIYYRMANDGTHYSGLLRLINTAAVTKTITYRPRWVCANGATETDATQIDTILPHDMLSGGGSGLLFYPCPSRVPWSTIQLLSISVSP